MLTLGPNLQQASVGTVKKNWMRQEKLQSYVDNEAQLQCLVLSLGYIINSLPRHSWTKVSTAQINENRY